MRLPVFYSGRMVADSRSMSPSAAKPAQVVASWRERGLPIDVIEPAPVTLDELARVHERAWVEDVIAGREPNGFGNCSREVAATLVWTTGSMLSAARHAIASRTIAAAPCSGFHHAGRRAGAFCTFNGLVVAACALHAEGARRVGIVDLDMHYGDGTDYLIRQHGLAFIDHFTAGADYHDAHQAPRFFERLPDRLREMADCDVILYQAGADPHVDDPLGGWLTTEELARRDRIVFGEFAAVERYEPRGGFVWVRGHWDWRGDQWAWVPGHYERERAGYVYQEPRWEERDGAWISVQGSWTIR